MRKPLVSVCNHFFCKRPVVRLPQKHLWTVRFCACSCSIWGLIFPPCQLFSEVYLLLPVSISVFSWCHLAKMMEKTGRASVWRGSWGCWFSVEWIRDYVSFPCFLASNLFFSPDHSYHDLYQIATLFSGLFLGWEESLFSSPVGSTRYIQALFRISLSISSLITTPALFPRIYSEKNFWKSQKNFSGKKKEEA